MSKIIITQIQTIPQPLRNSAISLKNHISYYLIMVASKGIPMKVGYLVVITRAELHKKDKPNDVPFAIEAALEVLNTPFPDILPEAAPATV